MKTLFKKLKKSLEITATENPKDYFGLEINKNEDEIKINQKRYAERVLAKYKINESYSKKILIQKKNSEEKTHQM